MVEMSQLEASSPQPSYTYSAAGIENIDATPLFGQKRLDSNVMTREKEVKRYVSNEGFVVRVLEKIGMKTNHGIRVNLSLNHCNSHTINTSLIVEYSCCCIPVFRSFSPAKKCFLRSVTLDLQTAMNKIGWMKLKEHE